MTHPSIVPYPYTDRDELLKFDGIDQRVRSSEREIEQLGPHLDSLGSRRVLVLSGQNVLANSNVVDRVEAAVGGRLVGRFSECEPHSPVSVLLAAQRLASNAKPDTVISVGGGSTMAIAKGLALLDASDEPLERFQMRFEPPDKVIAPSKWPAIKMKVVSVPTTMGCAEFGRHIGGFTTADRSRKIVIAGDGQTGPHLILIDGCALATTPTAIQRSTALGQLRIAVETFASVQHNPLGDALTLHATRLLVATLYSGWDQEPAWLLRVKSAAALASMGLASVGSMGACSALAHQLGAVCDVSHGNANAVLLAPVIRWNAASLGPRLRPLAHAFGLRSSVIQTPTVVGKQLAATVTGINRELDIATRLRDLNVNRKSLPAVASAAMHDPSLLGNPRPVSEADLLALLRSAW